MPREFTSLLGSKAKLPVLCWPLVLCLLCLDCTTFGAQAALTSGEIEALEQLYTNFPSLAVAHSQLAEISTGPVGKAWTTNFTSFCDHGEGYKFNGIYCHDGHVSGINITQQWGTAISANYTLMSGLNNLKNITNSFSGRNVELIIALVQNVAVERIEGSSKELTDTAFAFPESLLRLQGVVSSTFNISTFSNLQELSLSDYPIPSIIDTWVWPYNTLEVLEFGSASTDSNLLPAAWWLDHYHLFPVLRVLKGVWYAGTNGTSFLAVVESQTLKTLEINLRDTQTPANLTINCSTCLEVNLVWQTSTVHITAPSLRELSISAPTSWPHLSTPLPDLMELTVRLVGRYDPPAAFPSLDFAPSLRSFESQVMVTDQGNWIRILCSLPPTLRSLSLLQVQMDQPMQFPSCLSSVTSIYLEGAGQKFNVTTLFLNLPSSLRSLYLHFALNDPVSLEKFKKFTALRYLTVTDTNLVDDFPADFFQTLQELSYFACSASVTGTIPSAGWNSLQTFILSSPVTSWECIDSAPNLRQLYISSAALSRLPSDETFLSANLQSLLSVGFGDAISGPVPTFWTSLPQLEEVSLLGNLFSGPFAATLSSPKLLRVDLSFNNICGSLPEVTAPINLLYMYLEENQFSGSIPDSWSVNLSYVSELTFYNNPINGTLPDGLIEKNETPDLTNTNLVGPVWKMSRYIPFEITIVNSGIDICLVDPEIPLGSQPFCHFTNVTSCPEDCPSYWPCRPSSAICNRLTQFIPQKVGECIAPPDPSSLQCPPPASLRCPPPAPPGFVCVNGQYISKGSVTLEGVTLPSEAGVIVVKGNLSINGTLTFTGLGSAIEVEGCLDLAPSQVQIVLNTGSSVAILTPKTLISQKGSDCANDLSKIPVVLDERKDGCERTKLSTSASTRASLVVAFAIDSSRCNIKWIILGSVLGGIVVLSVIGVLILHAFSPSFRAFFKKTCCCKK